MLGVRRISCRGVAFNNPKAPKLVRLWRGSSWGLFCSRRGFVYPVRCRNYLIGVILNEVKNLSPKIQFAHFQNSKYNLNNVIRRNV